jgi:uncharacterized membrane protein
VPTVTVPAPTVAAPAPAPAAAPAPAVFTDEADDGDDTIEIEGTAIPLGFDASLSTQDAQSEEDEEDEVIIYIEERPLPLVLWSEGTWALWNLILSLAGAALALMTGIRVLMKKREEKDAENIYAEKSEKKKCSRLFFILATPLLAIVGILLFILTQDMRLTVIMTDWWTPVHVVLFAGGIFSYVFAYRNEKTDTQFNEEA